MPKIQVVATSDMIPTTGYELSSTKDFADHKNSEKYSNVVNLNPNWKSNYFLFCRPEWHTVPIDPLGIGNDVRAPCGTKSQALCRNTLSRHGLHVYH